MESVRIDKWLWAARIFKSRTLAQRACAGGHVRVNERTVKASHPVRPGDRVSALAPRGEVVLEVLQLADTRLSPRLSLDLYTDHSPPPPPREEVLFQRPRGTGRPTKAERRALERFRR